jgi:hypothetical protein
MRCSASRRDLRSRGIPSQVIFDHRPHSNGIVIG